MNTKTAAALAAAVGTASAYALHRRSAYSFRGRSVIVTGGSRGLGLLLARAFAEEGALLTLLARDGAELARAKDELAAAGASVAALECDVRSREAVEEAVGYAVDHWGGIDVLVNNAGVIQVGPLDNMGLDDFGDAIDTHFWGPLYGVMAVLPHMRRQRGGRIVNIASFGGKVAVPHMVPYCASKFALVGLSQGLRSELVRHRIHVTTVSPGLMRTGSTAHAQFKGQHEKEYAWFAVAGSSPLLSISGERAARKIVEACRRGDPELILTPQARAMVIASAVLPELVAHAAALIGLLLPEPDPAAGDERREGWQSRSPRAPAKLTRLSDEASARNNELPAPAAPA
jgi:NAD(P)-dependent dehydrogenase (short-subunit alcohol dehydrogenase family)